MPSTTRDVSTRLRRTRLRDRRAAIESFLLRKGAATAVASTPFSLQPGGTPAAGGGAAPASAAAAGATGVSVAPVPGGDGPSAEASLKKNYLPTAKKNCEPAKQRTTSPLRKNARLHKNAVCLSYGPNPFLRR